MYFSAPSTRSMRVLTAKQSTAHNAIIISAVLNARVLPIRAVSSQITASTGSSCSTEPRNTWSLGSVDVQDPKSQYVQYRTMTYCQ